METLIKERPLAGPATHYAGARLTPTGPVTNEDYAGDGRVRNGDPRHVRGQRAIFGPETQMAFDVYGTKGALRWNLERLNELRLYRATTDRGSGYVTVRGGDRFAYHGTFVPGSGNSIGYEDLKMIEDYEFCAAVAEAGRSSPGSNRRWPGPWSRTRCCGRRTAAPGSRWPRSATGSRSDGRCHDRGRAPADRGHRGRADRADARSRVVHEDRRRLLVALAGSGMLMLGVIDTTLIVLAIDVLHTGEAGVGFLNAALGDRLDRRRVHRHGGGPTRSVVPDDAGRDSSPPERRSR